MSNLGQPIESNRSLFHTLRGATSNGNGSVKPTPPADNLSDFEKELETRFEAREPRQRISDLILPSATRRNFEVLLSRISNHDLLYRDWGLSKIDPQGCCKTVNFYGPPGTGKTMCAEALAAELGRKIVEVNYAEIESKYVGETSQRICAAFRRAQSEQPGAVLFFDEADSILGRRMTNVTQAADHSVNVSRAVMLKQLDAFPGVVAFATNLAKNFDGAFVRRILLHVEVPAPDRAGRHQLWQRMFNPTVPGRDQLDWDRLADTSEGLVGGEIKNAVLIAAAVAASRPEETHRVNTDDVLQAIADVQRAKRDIGRYDFDAV